MKKLLAALFLLASAAQAEPLKTVFNPFTGKLDYITKIDSNTIVPGACINSVSNANGTVTLSNSCSGGLGGSTLAVFNGAPLISSPTAIVNFDPAYLTAVLRGGATAYVSLAQGTTDFIRNQNTLQAGGPGGLSTFYVSSGTAVNLTTTLAKITTGVFTNIDFNNQNRDVGVGFQSNNGFSGNDNTTVGFQSFLQNVNGTDNTEVGTFAGFGNTTGIANTSLGSFALEINSIGSENTALGAFALPALVTGSTNTAVGFAALNTSTATTGNVAVGAYALAADVFASSNTAVGTSALAFDTTGINNTAVGAYAGAGNIDRTSGAAISTAPWANVFGNNNVWIGAESGQNVSSNTAINNSIAIGFHSAVGASNTAMIGGNVGSTREVNLMVATMTVLNLPSGQCVQTAGGGLLTTTGGACGSGGGGGSPGGANGNVQVKSGTSFAGISNHNIYPSSTVITSSGNDSNPLLTMTISDTVNNPGGIVMTSTGTGIPFSLISNGVGGNCFEQDGCGAVNIKQFGIGDMLVLVSSYNETQLGTSDIEIWDESPNRNDPEVWFHRSNQNSSPEIRFDSPSPNLEMVNTSTAASLGLGKWEPAAIAFQGVALQHNSRAENNSTFEHQTQFMPLSRGGGMQLFASNTSNGDNVVPQAAPLQWETTDYTHTVGIRGPSFVTNSWYWTLPATFNNAGQLLYQRTNSPDRNLDFIDTGLSGQVLTLTASSTPTWTTPLSASGPSFSIPYKQFGTGQLVAGNIFYDTNNNSLSLQTTAALELNDTTNTHFVGWKSSNTLPGSTIWVMPDIDGNNGDVLTTYGAAGGHATHWVTPSSGGGTPGGSSNTFQYKVNSTTFGGASDITYNSATNGLRMGTTAQIEFDEADNAHYAGIVGTTETMTGSYSLVMPTTTGNAGNFLTTKGPGAGNNQLYWANQSGTNFILNQSTLQSGATAFPDFLQVGSTETITGGGGLIVKFGISASTISVNNQTNTGVAFMSGTGQQQLQSTTLFTWNGSSVAVTRAGISASSMSIVGGHLNARATNTPPTLTSCGSTPSPTITGSDTANRVIVGGTATGCIITFNLPFTNVPTCTVADENGSITNTFSYNVGTSSITITDAGLSNNTLDTICVGRD